MTSREISLENILAGMDLDTAGKLTEVEAMLALTPNNSTLLILKGRLLSLSTDQTVDVADIEKCFFAALSADPESIVALSELAHLYSLHNQRKAIIFASKCTDEIVPILSEMTEIISNACKELFVSKTWKEEKALRPLMTSDLLNQTILPGLTENLVLEILGAADRVDMGAEVCPHGSKRRLVYEIPDTCPNELRLNFGANGCICCLES